MAAANGMHYRYSRTISGCIPGQIDPSQPARLLHVPGSTLSFASFDPHAASPSTELDLESLSIKDRMYTQKRVVIETFPTGRSHWRFVPKAKWATGVADEGSWPRVVNIAGEPVFCSQDQWDIYKLDPAYECSVYPYMSTITPKPDPPFARPASQSNDTCYKRRISSLSPDDDHGAPSAKRRREVIVISSDTEDDDEVQEMIVDPDDTVHHSRLIPKTRVPARRTRKHGDDSRRNRLARAEEKAARMNAGMSWETRPVPSTPKMASQQMPPPSSTKRKSASLSSFRPHVASDLLAEHREGSPSEFSPGDAYKPSKRVRTKSPKSIKHEAAIKIRERKERRDKEAKRREELRREQRDRAFMEDIWKEAPDLPEEDDPEFDEERAREIALEESRRKLAELEKDKPLWDAAARERERREREEEAQLRAEAERRRRKAEEERAKAAAAARERQAREDAERRLREAEARREKERRARLQRQRWARGPWTTERALERYRTLCEEFDSRRFSTSDPLVFEDVPWPTLRAPLSFAAEDIDWSAVEAFFGAVRAHMRWQDYKAFVEKSHRRFHPDRWSSRGLLSTIVDETERSMMEVAANTVAQALTPLWREAKGH